jgi:rhodanese-related sulfurtransferase
MGCQGQLMGTATAVSAQEAKQLIEQHLNDPQFLIIDMRTPNEYRQGHIAGAILVDYYSPHLKETIGRLDRTRTYLVYCRSGNRSGRALNVFSGLGFKQVYHLSQGILEWKAQRLPLVTQG